MYTEFVALDCRDWGLGFEFGVPFLVQILQDMNQELHDWQHWGWMCKN